MSVIPLTISIIIFSLFSKYILNTNTNKMFSVLPQSCLHNCTCHRSPWDRVNIFDCQKKSLTSLPETVLDDTDWLLLSGNNLGSLNKAPNYLENITLLNLSSSEITEIGEKVMEIVIKSVKHLDIRGNNLKEIPQINTTANNISKFWISINPYECNCDMLWMKDWLMDTKTVMDKENVNCSGHKVKGERKQFSISKMKEVNQYYIKFNLKVI